MAVRYRKQHKTWQVYWKNPITGKQEAKSFASKEEAEKENSLILHRLKYERESFRPVDEPTESDNPTFEQVYLEYLQEKRFDKRDLSRHLNLMRYALEQLGTTTMDEISLANLEDIKKHFMESEVTPATVHGHLSALRTVIYFANSKGYCDLKFPKIPSPQYQTFVPPSPQELEAIYSVASPTIQRVIVIGAYLGVRIGECELFKLTWDDVDFSRKILRVHGSKKNQNAMAREVPIRESLVPLFKAWYEADQKLYSCDYIINYKGRSVKSIKRSWQTALKRAGITRRIRPYDLRHAFGTELVAAGVDIGTVAKLMGHSSPTMLLNHYQFVMDKQKRAAVEALPVMARSYGAKNKELTDRP